MGFIFLLVIPVLIIAFIIFDLLLKKEYEFYKENWRQDGKPYGFFWLPPDSHNSLRLPSFKGAMARGSLSTRWLFSTPSWIRNDIQVYRLLKWYRVFGFSFFGIILVPVIIMLVILFLYFVGYNR